MMTKAEERIDKFDDRIKKSSDDLAAKAEGRIDKFEDRIKKSGDDLAAKAEGRIDKFDDRIRKSGDDLAVTESKRLASEKRVEELTVELQASKKSVAEAKLEIEQVKYDFVLDGLKDRVENTLSELVLIDQLRYDSYGRQRDMIEECVDQLRGLEANSRDVKRHRRYVNFAAAVHEFASSRPRPIDKATADHILKVLADVPGKEQTCNYWYFQAMILARSKNLPKAMEAMDKAPVASGGTSPLTSTLITYGKLFGDLMDWIDNKTLKNEAQSTSLGDRFEVLLSESPYYWPARIAYSMLLGHLDRKGDALEQLAIAVDGGGASIENIIESIRHELTMPEKHKYQLTPSYFPDPNNWESALRAKLKELVAARRVRAQSKG
jgi:hypothetical protein